VAGTLSDAVARQFVRLSVRLSVAFACTDLATRSDISRRSRYDVHIALWQVFALSQCNMLQPIASVVNLLSRTIGTITCLMSKA